MNLIELINHAGLENIILQRVDQSLVNITTDKKGISKVTFETSQINATEVVAMCDGNAPKMHGLIIWIPSDKLPTRNAPGVNLNHPAS